MTDTSLIIRRTTHILRTCAADMTSHGGFFRWPESGHVAAPDWRSTAECGHGLHGFLAGEGDGSLADWSEDAKWIVARIEEHVDLGGNVKAPEAWVEHVGDRLSATSYLMSLGYCGAIVGCAVVAGDWGTATAGDGGTATAGDGGTATAGYRGTATAGYRGTITLSYWDGQRRRLVTIYPGEDGIEPNRPYRLDAAGKPVPAPFEPRD